MFFLYRFYFFFSLLIYPLLILFLKNRLKKKKESPERWREKLGFYTKERPKGKLIWIHVASVGEMNSIITLVSLLRQDANILITSTTLTSSYNFEIKNFGENVFHQFAPFDSVICVRRFLEHFKPNLFCVVESEIWPIMLHETSKICKIFSINTALSPKSLKKWKEMPNLFYWIFSHFYMVFPSSKSLALEISNFKNSNVSFVGNLKYDTQLEVKTNELLQSFDMQKKIICFANIHDGEEELIMQSLQELLKQDFYIILIPRHTEKAQKMAYNLSENGISCIIKSKNCKPEVGKVFILDEMGENVNIYSISYLVVMGGSFLPIGGHNIIEATHFAKPVIIGENYFKCKEVIDEFLENRAVVISSNTELLQNIIKVLKDNELYKELSLNAKECSIKHQGVSEKIYKIIKALI